MLYRKPPPVVTILVGAAFAAYHAGQHFRYLEPTPGQIIGLATAASTSVSTSIGLMVSPTTFAKVDPPPPIVPPNRKFEQG